MALCCFIRCADLCKESRQRAIASPQRSSLCNSFTRNYSPRRVAFPWPSQPLHLLIILHSHNLLSFWECHSNGSMKDMTFWSWLYKGSRMHLETIQVVACINSLLWVLFYCLVWFIFSSHGMDVSLCVNPFTHWKAFWLFQFGAIENRSCYVQLGVHFEWMAVFICLGLRFLCYIVLACLVSF